jgi:tetratricopeptide (TPR) repeat protein
MPVFHAKPFAKRMEYDMGNVRKMNRGGGMKKIFFKSILLGLLMVWMPMISLAADAAKLISMKGSVMISADGKDGWKAAAPGMGIPEGFYIKVGKKSEAALMLTDRSQIRLRDNSLIRLKKAGSSPEEKNQRKGILSFFKGEFWMRNKRQVMKPDINTASLNMSIRGTELKVAVDADTGETTVTALEGEIHCKSTVDVKVITRGTEAVARKDGKIRTHTLMNPESSVQWLLVTLHVKGPADEFPATEHARLSVDLAGSAMKLLSENQLENAYETAVEAVRISPENASANIALATILQVRGELDSALMYAQKGLSADPFSEPALLRTVELLLGQNRVQGASRLTAGFKGKKTGLSHMLEGFVFLIKKDADQAEKLFEKAIFLETDLARAWAGLGLSLYAQGKISQGLGKLETASLLDPLSAFPHNYLGKALYEAKEYQEAEVEFVRARQLDPNDPTPWLYLAIMAQDNFAPAKSVQYLQKAIEMNDNRFVSRSRFLLDMDRSVKNINLAAAMSDLGLNEWARHMGNQAIWQDEANSSAYLFRGSEAISLSRVDVSTLSDLRRAQLLSPVNSNTFPSYTDYDSLLEIPEHIQTLEVYAGTDETAGTSLTARGGQNSHSYLASIHMDTTDGPDNHTGSSARYLDLQYKTDPVFNHQVSIGFTGGKQDFEDITALQNGFATANDDETDIDFYQINSGYHWRVSPGQDLLVSLQYQNRDSHRLSARSFELVPNVWYNWADSLYQDDKRYRAEAIDLIKYKSHSMTIGAALGRLRRDIRDRQAITSGGSPGVIVNQQNQTAEPGETEIRVFAKDIWQVSDTLMLDMGLGWCRFDADNKQEVTRFLPRMGAVLKMNTDNLIRASYFKEIQPDYLSATLLPVETAGFSTVTGVPSGTLTESYGLAFDRQWGARYFTSIEALFKKKQYNTPYRPHPDLQKSWTQEDAGSLGVTLNYLLSDHYALSLTQRFARILPDDAGLDRRDSETGIRFTCAYPFGLTLQTAWWFVDQKFDDTQIDSIDKDHFILGSLSARQRLFDKKLEIFLRLDNILDQSFSYVPEESMAGINLPWQGIFFLAGFQVKF